MFPNNNLSRVRKKCLNFFFTVNGNSNQCPSLKVYQKKTISGFQKSKSFLNQNNLEVSLIKTIEGYFIITACGELFI